MREIEAGKGREDAAVHHVFVRVFDVSQFCWERTVGSVLEGSCDSSSFRNVQSLFFICYDNLLPRYQCLSCLPIVPVFGFFPPICILFPLMNEAVSYSIVFA